jgi:Tol biopolymer transport system component
MKKPSGKSTILTATFIFLLSATLQAQNTPQAAFDCLNEFPRIRDFSFSADGSQAWFTLQSMAGDISVLAFMNRENEGWSKPVIAPFSGQYRDLEPAFTPDGKRLWFASNRPLEDQGAPKDFDLWYVEWDENTKIWKEPVNPGSPLNSSHDEFYPSVATSGTVYFTSTRPGSLGEDDIFMCTWQNGNFTEPAILPETINSTGAEYNAFIAPDESFIIYSAFNRPGGMGNGDLFISFRDSNMQWQAAQNLGNFINSPFLDYSPFVDMHNKVLYFTSNRRTPSQKTITALDDFMKEINRYENGLLRLYKISIAELLLKK